MGEPQGPGQSGGKCLASPSLSQQALQQNVTQYSAGQEHGPRRHNPSLSVTLSDWPSRSGLSTLGLRTHCNTRCQARPKQTAQGEAGSEGRGKMEQGKRNHFFSVETSLSLTMSAFKTKIKQAIPEKRKGMQVYTVSCSTTNHSHPAMI